MASFSRRMALALILLSLLTTLVSWYVGGRFLLAVERSLEGAASPSPASDPARARAARAQQQRSLQTGYLWAGVALLGFGVMLALLTGWLLFRWLFRELLHLRLNIRQTVPHALPALSEAARVQEPVAGLQNDIQQLLEKLLEQQHNEVFKEQVERWQDVARRLAHEIRNPLTPILLTVQELERQYRHDDPRYNKLLKTSVGIVQEEVTALRRIVEEFSAFARLPQVRLEPQDLNRVVREFLEAYNWFRGRAVVDLEAHDGPLSAAIDRMLLQRVLHNLVENAIEAGSPAILVRTGILPTQEVICQIEDRGPGIPEHLQSKIFTPYFTTKQMGTGLGLSITKKIVIDHGGAITVSANPEGGATFTIRLPSLLTPQESESNYA